MADLIFSDRKGAVLTHPAIPCLEPFHTINLTAGCPFSCRYCYAQSFRNYPGKGKVVFYANTFQALVEQLPRKRKAPELVFFSSACDPFAPFSQTLDCLHDCMSLLLRAGSRILISTKGIIPNNFIELFAQHHERVYVEIGFTTVDDDIRQLLEPCAPSAPKRLQLLKDLGITGVAREIRMIPLIPELTDDEERFENTMAAVSRCGVTRGSMSYLFLRQGNLESMACQYGVWDFREIKTRIFTKQLESLDRRSSILVPSCDYRANKYKILRKLAQGYGIHMRLCSCKNPDLVNDCCHPLAEFRESEACQSKEKTGNLFAGIENKK